VRADSQPSAQVLVNATLPKALEDRQPLRRILGLATRTRHKWLDQARGNSNKPSRCSLHREQRFLSSRKLRASPKALASLRWEVEPHIRKGTLQAQHNQVRINLALVKAMPARCHLEQTMVV